MTPEGKKHFMYLWMRSRKWIFITLVWSNITCIILHAIQLHIILHGVIACRKIGNYSIMCLYISNEMFFNLCVVKNKWNIVNILRTVINVAISLYLKSFG